VRTVSLKHKLPFSQRRIQFSGVDEGYYLYITWSLSVSFCVCLCGHSRFIGKYTVSHCPSTVRMRSVAVRRWGQRAQAPQILPRPPNFFQGNLGTVFLLLVDVIVL